MKMYFFHQKIKLLKKFIKHRLGDLSLQANGDCGNAGNIQAHCGSLFQTFSHTVFGYSLIVNMQFNNLGLQFLSEVFFFSQSDSASTFVFHSNLGRFFIFQQEIFILYHCQFSSVTQSCPTLCNHRDCRTPGFPVYDELPELLKLMIIESMKPSNHLILCHPLLLPPSIFSSISIFPNDSVLHIRWPKYGVSPSASVLPMNIQD